MIENYIEKMDWMIINQDFKCSGCGLKFIKRPQFAHWKSRTEDNVKKWPLFIDSILNASAQDDCNVERINQYGKEPPSDLLCEKAEAYLRANPTISQYVNKPTNHEFAVEDIWQEIEEREK
jgi:hypothetical protein